MTPRLTASHEFRFTTPGDCGHEASNLIGVGYKQVKICGPCCGELWTIMQVLPYIAERSREPVAARGDA